MCNPLIDPISCICMPNVAVQSRGADPNHASELIFLLFLYVFFFCCCCQIFLLCLSVKCPVHKYIFLFPFKKKIVLTINLDIIMAWFQFSLFFKGSRSYVASVAQFDVPPCGSRSSQVQEFRSTYISWPYTAACQVGR